MVATWKEMSDRKSIDIVVAVCNEEQATATFVQQVAALDLPEQVSLQFIFVEDGSTDRTREVLMSLARVHPNLTYYFLTEGDGQTAALAFGLHHSKGDAVIMMDVDGEHPPSLIPILIERFEEGYDVIQCRRYEVGGQRPFLRRCAAAAFRAVFSLVSGTSLANQNVYFRMIKADIRDSLKVDRRWTHFMRLTAKQFANTNHCTVAFQAPSRQTGQSKYGPKRLAQLALNALLGFLPARRFYGLCLATAAIATWCLSQGQMAMAALLLGLDLYLIWKFNVLCSSFSWEKLRIEATNRPSMNDQPLTPPPRLAEGAFPATADQRS